MRNLILALLVLQAHSALALSDNAKMLVDFETKSNAVSTRSNAPVQIEHFEIPLSVVKTLVSDNADQEALKSLTFKKNGIDYVRWIINPEDTKWSLEVEKFLKDNRLDANRYKYFIGYQSASRSYMIEDPVTRHEFFAKVSTNKTGGNWKDKKQEWSDAADVKAAADHVQAAIAKYKPEYFKYMDESLVLGLESIEQGMVVRSVKGLSNSEYIYLPGFSAMHESTGDMIAKRNGWTDTEAFWNEHYNKPLARAMAELLVMTGLSYDSPHSQNFLVELDKELRPTGKIIFRDTGDVYVTSGYTKALGSDLASKWPTENVIRDLNATVGIMHGNTKPKWLSEKSYEKWGREFFAEYDKTFSRLTGISDAELIKNSKGFNGTALDAKRVIGKYGDYMGRSFDMKGSAWENYLQRLSKDRGFVHPAILSCGRALTH